MTAPDRRRNDGRMFGLTRLQLNACERGDGAVTLTPGQADVLRRQGLVTGPGQWHHSPSGSFALAPRNPWEGRRTRLDLQPITTQEDVAA